MKNLKIIISIAVVCFLITGVYAQKIKVEKGDLSSFKGITELNMEYDFSNMAVGKFKTEAEYIEKKKAEYNEDEPGKGDTWDVEWNADKENTYQPKFEQLFNLVMLSKRWGWKLDFFQVQTIPWSSRPLFLNRVSISASPARMLLLM